MNLEKIVAEMRRKPDAQLLIEWLYDNAEIDPDAIRAAIDAYDDAVESQ